MKNISPLSTVWLRHLLDVHQQPLQILLWKNRQHNTPQTNKQTNNAVNQQRPGRIQIRQTKTRNTSLNLNGILMKPLSLLKGLQSGPGCAATGGGKGSFMATWWTVRRRHAIPTTPICVGAKETKYFTGWPRTQPPKQEECLRLHDRWIQQHCGASLSWSFAIYKDAQMHQNAGSCIYIVPTFLLGATIRSSDHCWTPKWFSSHPVYHI